MPFNFFGLGKKPEVKASTMVAMTDVGKNMAEKHMSSGATFVILSKLNEKSPQMVAEIAQASDMDINEVKERIKELSKSGVIRIMGGEG